MGSGSGGAAHRLSDEGRIKRGRGTRLGSWSAAIAPEHTPANDHACNDLAGGLISPRPICALARERNQVCSNMILAQQLYRTIRSGIPCCDKVIQAVASGCHSAVLLSAAPFALHGKAEFNPGVSIIVTLLFRRPAGRSIPTKHEKGRNRRSGETRHNTACSHTASDARDKMSVVVDEHLMPSATTDV
jgi:hypothetical protein